jgi:predicted alpha-1,2-mannosidase
MIALVVLVALANTGGVSPFLLGSEKSELVDLPELLAGTDAADGFSNSNGNTLPQVKRPWGFNDWAPQTYSPGVRDPDHVNWWFRRSDRDFHGMRCTHQPSPWIGDYSYFLLQPHLSQNPGALKYDPEQPSRSIFRPHFFESSLLDPESGHMINFEITPTNHAAAVRVQVPPGVAGGSLALLASDGVVEANSDNTITGYTSIRTGGAPDDWKLFYILKPLSGNDTVIARKSEGILEWHSSASFDFKRGSAPAQFAIATSFISLDQAKLNLQHEIGSKTFDQVKQEGRTIWNDSLSRITVKAQDSVQESVFYTNLWKSMLFPRFLHEVDESGKEVHKSPYNDQVLEGKVVTDSGFWDSYTTVYPLQSVAFPEIFGNMVEGWINSYKEAGWLPTWPSPGQRVSMVGTMGDVSLADAIAKKSWGYLEGFNSSEAYAAIRKDAFDAPSSGFGREGLSNYIELGYVPSDAASESVSRTLNYYVADAAIARAAEILGKAEDHDELHRRSMNYEKIFDKETQFFRPKSIRSVQFTQTSSSMSSGSRKGDSNFLGRDQEGQLVEQKEQQHSGKVEGKIEEDDFVFEENFDPLSWGGSFTEAGPWQYRFYVPFDVEGLKKLYQGSLCTKIHEMVAATGGEGFHVGSYGRVIHEMSEMEKTRGRFGQYAHNNQPSHHILWLAKKAGCNTVADRYLRAVMSELYTTKGWPGDEDDGQMASWYILSALGIYSLEGAKDEMVLGSPAVESATVKLPKGRFLHISTSGQSRDSVYVQSVTWTPSTALAENATPMKITSNVIKYTDLMAGGTLHFDLSRIQPGGQVRTEMERRLPQKKREEQLPVLAEKNIGNAKLSWAKRIWSSWANAKNSSHPL